MTGIWWWCAETHMAPRQCLEQHSEAVLACVAILIIIRRKRAIAPGKAYVTDMFYKARNFTGWVSLRLQVLLN